MLAGLIFSMDWLNVNGQFALNDFNNLYPVKGYDVFDGQISFDKGNFRAHLAISNLLNERYSAYVASNAAGEVRYNPAPERTYRAGLSLTL